VRRPRVFTVVLATTMFLVGNALAGTAQRPRPPFVAIGVSSQQAGPKHAAISARINVASERPGQGALSRSERVRPGGAEPQPVSTRRTGTETRPRVVYPTIPSNSPLLRNPTPLGPGSFWYTDTQGYACPYQPDSVLPCFRVVAPGTGGTTSGTGIDPTAVAASVADRLPLSPGEIHASPDVRGLTGAASWFWLDPAPSATSLSVTLAGERVTVTAKPAGVEWRFGDEGAFSGGVGIPYRPGLPPPEAVTHVYGTRCLPGDQGRNPYVLASCGQDGYAVEAAVSWRVSYDASGPVGASGVLPSRTTETAVVYPVSEARAFLLGGGSQ
jgi:hypothetical protein